jgi:hypothetical protein
MDFVFECSKCSRRKKEQHPSLMEAARSLPFCDFDRTRMRLIGLNGIGVLGGVKRLPPRDCPRPARKRPVLRQVPAQGRQEALL